MLYMYNYMLYMLLIIVVDMQLPELRQLYFQLREKVFSGGIMSTARRSEELETILRHQFKNKLLSDVEYPR